MPDAISWHRIPGVGPKRKKALKYLGDLQSIARAEIKEFQNVLGISQRIAKNIFDYFHKPPRPQGTKNGIKE
jgi:excinuclease UvrABC nuclease subunit